MAYTIKQAITSKLFSHVVVSTDSEIIAETAKSFGAESWFLRPKTLSTDDAPKLPVIHHALLESEKYFSKEFDIIIDLDTTSPLRKVEDITNSYKQFIDEDADILITGCPSKKNPYFNMVEVVNGKVNLIKHSNSIPKSRQKAPEVFDMNASIYIWKRKTLLNCKSLFTDKTSLYIMPEERSIDIDSEHDWDIVNFLMKKKV